MNDTKKEKGEESSFQEPQVQELDEKQQQEQERE